MISLNTNITDLILLNTLNSSTFGINQTIERLTTGYKLNHAKDNAANLSIVTDLSTRISSLLKLRNNTEDGISLLSTAQGALENIQDQLARLRALSVQAANGTYGSQSLDAMQAEADAIIEQIKQIRENTEFNGLNLFETPREEETVSQISNSKVRAYSARVAAQADNTISGAFDFAASETKTVTIDGVQYTIKNRESIAKTLSYTKDTTTGEVTLYLNNFNVRGEENKSHNLKIIGSNNYIYGGKLNDTIYVTGANYGSSLRNYIYGGDGNDTLISDCRETYLYGEGGNDNFIINSHNTNAYGGDGDDIFTVNTSSGVVNLYGQNGEDRFYIKNNINAYVDGGAGTNYAEALSNAILINVPNANANIIEFAASETKTVTINGLNYTITNRQNTASNFLYSINDDGALEIKSRYFNVKGDENQKHNIKISIGNVYYYAGNMGDKIVSTTKDVHIYGGNGDDDISIVGYTYLNAGGGNNTISVSGSNSVVKAGNGNNVVTINGNYQCCSFDFGNGNNTILNSQKLSHSSIYAGSGTNTLTGGSPVDSLIVGFGSYDNASAFAVSDSGSSILNINGINYEISKKNDNGVSNLLYRYNAVTGEIEFAASDLNIRGDLNTSHNIIVQGGRYNSIYGGNLDDTIVNFGYATLINGLDGDDTITSTFTGDCAIYGGNGNDTITAAGAYIYGEDGDDTINIVGFSNPYTVNGGAGNDTYNLNSAINVIDNYGNNIYNINCSNISVSGGAGDDTFYMKGDNNIVLGGGGNDYVVIDGKNNTVDGGTGTNYYVDNGINTTLTNVNRDPNSGMLVFTYLGEVKTFDLDGKTYTVTNDFSGGNQLRYSFNPNTGTITLDGSNLTVDSELNKAHKLNIRGDNNTINGGNLSDIITAESGSDNIINTLGGDDTINLNSENNSVNSGDGNDTIILNSSSDKLINSGNGDDNIIVNSSNNSNIQTGTGNNRVTLNGSNNTLELGGNNTVNVRSDDNTITAGNGDNTFSISGSSNTVTTGLGNNKIGIDGDSNEVHAGNVTGDVNILGDGNTYVSQNGEEKVVINGNNNNVNSGSGDDKLEVRGNGNSVSSTSGDNTVTLRGDTNSYNGGIGVDKITISGNGNITNGGDANDEFLVAGGNGNIIDGEAGGRNTMINNGKNTQYTNVVDITPRPFELTLKVDLGSDANSFINMSISFNLFDFYVDFSDPSSLAENIEKIDDLSAQIEEQLLNIGSVINRLESVLESQSIQMENMLSTRSTLRDADVAKESSNMIKYEILQQASAALMASTRNINREFILGLLVY